MHFNRTEDIITDLRHGKMVVIMDDEDRENEGDLLMVASLARPGDINFMARHGRGLICLTLTKSRCETLRLPLMIGGTDRKQSTNFTVSIEAAKGVTTGISAADRARTIHAAVAPDATPQSLTQPGHMFPLMAQPGGVLTRAGHTEAGCDLARLAGFEPAAVIVEILNEDGSMARRDDLLEFARQHDLKIGTIADLIAYRIKNERSVEQVEECEFATEFGSFQLHAFQDHVGNALHFAFVKGEVTASAPTLVRVHVQNTLVDTLSGVDPVSDRSLRWALKEISDAGAGVVVVLRQADTAADIIAQLRTARLQPAAQEDGLKSHGKASQELRTYGLGAQILYDLGVRRMRVLSSPKRIHALSGFGIEVVEYVDSARQALSKAGRPWLTAVEA